MRIHSDILGIDNGDPHRLTLKIGGSKVSVRVYPLVSGIYLQPYAYQVHTLCTLRTLDGATKHQPHQDSASPSLGLPQICYGTQTPGRKETT